jgi:hypothetical protein
MNYIPIIIVLLFFAVPGCLDSSSNKQVSPSDSITNVSPSDSITNVSPSNSITNVSPSNSITNISAFEGKDGQNESDPKNSTMSIFAEKDVYRLNETMRIHIDFSSTNKGMGQVHVSGLKNPFDRLFINETREVIIEKGDNRFDFEFIIPSCEECTLLSPGMYVVNATVNIGGKTFESYRNITLERGV